MDILNLHEPEGIAWTIFVVAMLVIVAPRLAELIGLPGLIGLILSGFIIGPNGLDVVETAHLDAIGEIGLLFLMFLAGLELDLKLFGEYRRAAGTFGGLTFILPFGLAAISALLLDYEVAAAVLIGSIWASHTLITYPMLRSMDVVDNAAVATTVGATVITDTAALVILAVVVGTETGDASGVELALSLAIGLGVLLAVSFVALPWLSRQFFAGVGQERILRFVWLVAAMMGCAQLAFVFGIEGIVGAFFAGIGLNRLVPNRGALMERTHFFASSLFIPVFLIAVGDLIDMSVVLDLGTLRLAGIFLATVCVGKYAAAWIASKIFGFSRPEVGVMFSLSVAQAAATLAATIVGYEAGILDEEFLNAAVIVVSASLFIASVAATRFGRQLPVATAGVERLGANVIVPVRDLADLQPLLTLASQIAMADGGVVRPIFVAESGTPVEERRRIEKQIIDAAQATGIDAEPIVRVDRSLQAGVHNAVQQYEGTAVVMSRTRAEAVQSFLLGGDASAGLAGTLPVPLIAVSAAGTEELKRVLLVLEQGDLKPHVSPGVAVAINCASRLAEAGCELIIAAPDAALLPPEAASVKHEDLQFTGSRTRWAQRNARAGDIVLLVGRTGEALLSSNMDARAAPPGATFALVSAAPRLEAMSDAHDYAMRVAVGRGA